MAHSASLSNLQVKRLVNGSSSSEVAIADVWGFETNEITLYAHKPVLNSDGVVMKAVGEVADTYHINDHRNLLDHEKEQLTSRAMRNGWFPWEADEACLAVEQTAIALGFMGQQIRTKTWNGCKWCRERQTKPEAASEASLTSSPVSDPPPVLDPMACATCKYVPRERTQKGKKYAPSQRASALNKHLQTHQAA